MNEDSAGVRDYIKQLSPLILKKNRFSSVNLLLEQGVASS